MNVFLEFLKNKIKYSEFENEREVYKDFYQLRYDESSDFHLIDSFSIKECGSYLVILEDLLSKHEISNDCKNESSEIGICSVETQVTTDNKNNNSENNNLDYQRNLSDSNNIPAFSHAETNTYIPSNKNEDKIEIFDNNQNLTKLNYEVFETDIIQNETHLTDYEESIENVHNLCITPKVSNLKSNRNYKDEKIYFTPDNYNIEFEDKICINKDFNKSDILLLLRLKRKKLAILEGQLRKDLKSLDISNTIQAKNNGINEKNNTSNFVNCPAQLHFIKRRIDNTKEIIESTERDIALLEEKTSETY